MQFASATSSLSEGPDAIRDVIDQVNSQIEADSVDLAFVFVSHHDLALWDDLGNRLRAAFPGAVTLGCTAEGCIGDGRELERQSSVSLMVAAMPGVQVDPFHLSQEGMEEAEWTQDLPDHQMNPVFVTLGEPFSIDMRRVVDALEAGYAGRPILGGMASAGQRPGENRLLLDGVVYEDGLAGLALHGALEVTPVVSQGCRPIGSPYVVTQGEANVIRRLRNRPAMDVLQEMAGGLSSEDQALLQHGVFIGRAIDEYKRSFDRGDFLIQAIIDADKESGALAIAGEAKTGTTVQFHVRDAASADEDLRAMLGPFGHKRYAGALLFSCNGRGTRMWDAPGHDVGVLQQEVGALPVAGCFCAGEIGPIGGRNFMHGYTAVLGLFRSPDP
ncbi:MAG: FIST N-terminal domain-containing protein [Planctomycetota bacterium]|nr:FIST N-terminal domain-containing protein [Planctomycetota bacterium]